MSGDGVEYIDFQAFVAQIGSEALKMSGLPTSKLEFDLWWQRISLSDDLRTRWTHRIRLREKFVDEIAHEIEAIRKAA